MERCRRVPRREVRGAEKCRAVPLCREVLRCRRCRMVPRWSEALWRRSGGDAEARAKHKAAYQHGGCAWVKGPGFHREHRACLREASSCVRGH